MGPLNGYRIIEFAGVGPTQHCAMLLAELGADVIRLDKTGSDGLEAQALGGVSPDRNILNRSRRSLAVDLKHAKGTEAVGRLIGQADALIEGFRPGVMERLRLGPDEALALNPRLVYGRMTGWGQDGPLAGAAGHDLNYIALSGALAAIGPGGAKPVPPLNLVADMGGGALYLALGVVAGLLEAAKSGQGQVIDAAMVDGTASLMSFVYGLKAMGNWSETGDRNFLSGAAPYYQVYETADGKYVSIAPLEDKFFEDLIDRLELPAAQFASRRDPETWPGLSQKLADIFATRSRDDWCALLEGSDACFAPVLTVEEAAMHAHNKARRNVVTIDGIVQPAPAPRFSRTQTEIKAPPPQPGEHSSSILAEWGFSADEIHELHRSGAIS